MDVTFKGSEHISIALGDIEYAEIYNELAEKRSYNMKLVDGALVQLMYRVKSNRLIQHRLSFYPSPNLLPFQDDPEALERLATGRALVQVSFRSLAGTFGRTIKKTAWRLVEEDIADGSYIIKKDGKEIYYKPGRMDESGIEDDIIEVIEDRVKKASGGIGYMLGE